MAKVGTAHVEIKPVLNEESLEEIANRIQERVAQAVAAGVRQGLQYREPASPWPWEGARW